MIVVVGSSREWVTDFITVSYGENYDVYGCKYYGISIMTRSIYPRSIFHKLNLWTCGTCRNS